MRIRHLMLATLLLGAHAPSGQSHAIAMARPGLWAVSHSANGVNPERLCLADPMLLTQWEHRSMRCSRSVIAERMDQLTVQYICPNGEFGRSDVTVLTPRTLRIETQGIARNAPFDYVIHARRLGDCGVRPAVH